MYQKRHFDDTSIFPISSREVFHLAANAPFYLCGNRFFAA